MSSKEQEFFNACYENDLEKVKELSNQIDDINWGNPNGSDWTGLHISCYEGNKEIVEYLISHPKINVNKEDKNGRTPFYTVCANGKDEIVKILFASGREIDTTKKTNPGNDYWNNQTAAEIARYGKEQIAKLVDEYAKNPMEIILRLRNEMSKYLLNCSNFNKIICKN